MFSMHVACDMHTTLYSQYCDMHVSLNMHGSCMQHAHYMQEISTREYMIVAFIYTQPLYTLCIYMCYTVLHRASVFVLCHY